MHATLEFDDLVRRDDVRCPACGDSAKQRWGRTRGRTRYRCIACGTTFNVHTATAVAYTKRLDQWPLFLRLMNAGATLREAAVACGIHVSTAFRWRHATLQELRQRHAPELHGNVEVARFEFPLSFKGERELGDARTRGWDILHVEHVFVEKVHVLVMRTEDGSVRTLQCGRDVLGTQLREFARHRLEPDATLTGLELLRVSTYYRRGTRDVDHYERRLRGWLHRFHGVATRYLSRYLAWHRHRDGDVSPPIIVNDPWQRANVDWTEILRARRDDNEE
jgi:transposase-like protein